jgi:hypothetical protein
LSPTVTKESCRCLCAFSCATATAITGFGGAGRTVLQQPYRGQAFAASYGGPVAADRRGPMSRVRRTGRAT